MKYIPLDAVVAEIEKRLRLLVPKITFQQQRVELEKLLTSIDTLEVKEIGVDLGDPKGDKSAKYIIDTKNLEVKEVDLEREIQDHIKECLDVKFTTTDIELINKDVAYTAKKFFELGLKAQKGE